MKLRTTVLLAVAVLSLGAAPAGADEPLRVVATLSTFADLVDEIGGERVSVSYVAPPRFNPHFIEPRPSDVLKVKRADLFVHAGLDLELWRWPLVDAAGNPAVRPGGTRELDLSTGIELLEVPQGRLTRAAGDIHLYGNPHYWLDPRNVRVMARSVAAKLSEVDPKNGAVYESRLKDFLGRLDRAEERWRKMIEAVRGREAVAYHNQWPYLADFTGVRIEHFLEPKPGIPPTPKQVAFLEGHIRREGIPAIVQASFFPQTASRRLAEKSGARLVLLYQNVGEGPEARDTIGLIDYNVRQLADALK